MPGSAGNLTDSLRGLPCPGWNLPGSKPGRVWLGAEPGKTLFGTSQKSQNPGKNQPASCRQSPSGLPRCRNRQTKKQKHPPVGAIGRPDGVQVMYNRKHIYVGHMFSNGVTILMRWWVLLAFISRHIFQTEKARAIRNEKKLRIFHVRRAEQTAIPICPGSAE